MTNRHGNIDRLIIFDLKGSIAHFRKFYTNSSSLSYAFPPRTSIVGMIAGILGYERDTYYEIFNIDSCKIALSLRKPIRKIMQTVNYLQTKESEGGLEGLTGSRGHTSIPVEWILPICYGEILQYRIYFFHRDDELVNKFITTLQNNSFVYPPYLGITECIGKVTLVDICESSKIEEKLVTNSEMIEISTIVPIEKINSFDLIPGNKYMKEDRVPVSFNAHRVVTKVTGYVYEKNCKPIKVKINDSFYKVTYKDNDDEIIDHVVFME